MTPIDMKQKLPKILKENPFWTELSDAVSDEIQLLKDQMYLKKSYLNIRESNSISQLRDIANDLGMNIDIALLEGRSEEEIIQYYKKELRSTFFKISSKSLYRYYKYLFTRMGYRGEYYLNYFNIKMFRGLELIEIFNKLQFHDFTKPFDSVIPQFPVFNQFVSSVSLDANPLKTLDEATPWYLDKTLQGFTAKITNHSCIEFIPDRVIDGYLIRAKELGYLKRSVEFGRSVTEIPHCGIQLNLYAKKDGAVFSDSILQTSSVVTSEIYPTINTEQFAKVKILSNDEVVFEYDTIESQIYENANFYLLNVSVPGKTVYPDSPYIGDGVTTDFNTNKTLKHFPIIPKSIRITFKSNNEIYTGSDDGFGNIIGSNIEGSINYNTGVVNVFTKKSGVPGSERPPMLNEPIKFKYSISKNVFINKVQVFNINGIKVFESSFPLVEFNDHENHISFLIIIDRR